MWARVREDQEAEITFFDAMTTTSVFLLQSGRSSKLNQLNLVISFPRTSVGVAGAGRGRIVRGFAASVVLLSFVEIQVSDRELVFFNKCHSPDKIPFLFFFSRKLTVCEQRIVKIPVVLQ